MKELLIDTRRTGSGKTTSAIKEKTKELETRLSKTFKATFLLVPYGFQRIQLVQSEYFSGYVVDLEEYIRDMQTAYRRTWNKEQVIVATYAGINNALKDDLISIKDCLVIMDELPTFLQFAAYQRQQADLLEYLLDDELYDSATFYGMTGTPELLFDYCNKLDLPFKFVDDTPQKNVSLIAEKAQFIMNGSAYTYADYLIQSGFTSAKMFYVESAKQAISLSEKFNNAGYNAGFIISAYNDDVDRETLTAYNDLMEEQIFNGKQLTRWINEDSDIPLDLDVLIINAAVRDGISIMDSHSRIDEIIIQSADRMTIEQSRARIRHDVKQLTILYTRMYESIYRCNYADVSTWVDEYEQSDLKESMLRDRYENQIKATEQMNIWRTNRNASILRGEKINGKKPTVLDYLVLKSAHGFYLNKFVLAKAKYDIDNYEFLSSKTKLEFEDGFEIETTKTIKSENNNIAGSIDRICRKLSHMSKTQFDVFYGEEVKQTVNNMKRLESFDDSKWLNRKLLSDDKKALANELSICDSERRIKGWTTAKNYLKDNGYTIEEDRTYINGKRQRYALITK